MQLAQTPTGFRPIMEPQCVLQSITRVYGSLGNVPEASRQVVADLVLLASEPERGVDPRFGINPIHQKPFHRMRVKVRDELQIPLLHQNITYRDHLVRWWPALAKLPFFSSNGKADPVTKDAVATMPIDELDRLMAKMREPFRGMPDIAVEFVLWRAEVDREQSGEGQFDIGIYQNLFAVLEQDPLRFHSALGAAFLTRCLEDSTVARRTEYLTDIIYRTTNEERTDHDIRGVPILRDLLRDHPDWFTAEHMPGLFRVMAQFSFFASDLLYLSEFPEAGRAGFPELLRAGFESGFDENGRIHAGMRPVLERAWSLLGTEERHTYREEWLIPIYTPEQTVPWREYAMARFTSTSAHCALFTGLSPEAPLIARIRWGRESTPYLVDLYLHLRTSDVPATAERARKLRDYLTQRRMHHFNLRLGLFIDATPEEEPRLDPFIVALRDKSAKGTAPRHT